MTIDVDALVALMAKRQGAPSTVGMTVEEIHTATGMPPLKVRSLLKAGVLSGAVRMGVRNVPVDWDGRSRTYKVYVMAEKGAKA